MKPLGAIAASGGFGCRLTQLVELISERGTNGIERYEQTFGGAKGLADKVKSDLDRGISGTEEDLANRAHVFGANKTPDVDAKTLLELMWEAAQDPILLVLGIAAIISLILGIEVEGHADTGWIEGCAILVSIAVVVMVSAINDLQKEKQFRELLEKQSSTQMADVIRNGQQQRVNYQDLVVGDIVLVNAGLILPADGVLFRANNIKCDESALTGESHDIEKTLEENPWLLSGTSVKQGSGAMIITCVGLFSEEGIIQKLITGVGEEESERLLALDKEGDEQEKLERAEEKKSKKRVSCFVESILQAKLERMALQIGYGVTFMSILTLIVLILSFSIQHFGVDNHDYEASVWSEYVEFVTVAIVVLVVGIPEGLPLAVTISLAYSVKKMMNDNNLVRVLASCETMGNATTICSDKTGTLTTNRMTVVKSWMAGRVYDGSTEVKGLPQDLLARLQAGIALNSDRASNYYIDEESGLPVQENNKTECACLKFGDDIAARKYTEIRKDNPVDSYVKVYPFDSATKRMETIVRLPNGKYRMFVKGASEIILKYATAYDAGNESTTPLTAADREGLEQNVIIRFAEQALRVICIAYKDFDDAQDWDQEEALLSDLVISAFVGIQDPVRPEVPDAVTTCRRAGVTVRMVTGDNMITARAIAINCGIITEEEDGDGVVMEGPDFRRRVVRDDGSLDFDEINRIAPKLRVMGRCSPSDKFNLVKGLIKAGEVVAVTGDGTNDGPALSEADVGFSMGIAGTDVARQASDIVITDDNFSSIVKAISWGRNVYDGISKFLVFQLTVNVVAILVAFIGACAIRESPLRAVQLLWVNLIMDVFAALALATEPPTPELLDRAPYGRNKPLLSRIMLRQIFGHSFYQLVVLLLLIFYGDKMFNIQSGRRYDLTEQQKDDQILTQHYSMVFNTFVWMQIFNEINARVVDDNLNMPGMPRIVGNFYRPFRGFFSNPIFVGVIVGTAVVQVLIVEFGGRAIETEPLDADIWGACIGFGAGSLVWNWLEPGAYADLSPDRAAEIEEEQRGTTPELPPAGLDAPTTPKTARVERSNTVSSQRGAEPATSTSVLWSRVGRRVRRHIRVIGAFRTAGQIARLRRRTAQLATHAIGGPEARAPRRASEQASLEQKGHSVATPASAMWRTAVARVRFQLRVVRAFKNGVVNEVANPAINADQAATTTLTLSSNSQARGREDPEQLPQQTLDLPAPLEK
ncbi:uncharacterized protein MONBRDRAFT_9247 [Monosiga brevicollis MX1]|uniref:Calcium-transporting ATPase n=1 Tax=Monosiga brevicollis TaxID=81824 RepID=A9V2J2_MONBE|nr:uncharacterized protein MONBRDRAFT_9247 [Monosiga brevicollis MX1]EDQ88387.1 predicted protein [Monosiga brevicollis MX1]|eukprot:XP_001746980.1 hypothetical protein [Monosiga brevicollis MX1]